MGLGAHFLILAHHQQKLLCEGPRVLWAAPATSGITGNSKCKACSSYECVDRDWHLGNSQLVLNWEADKRTHYIFTTPFSWLFFADPQKGALHFLQVMQLSDQAFAMAAANLINNIGKETLLVWIKITGFCCQGKQLQFQHAKGKNMPLSSLVKAVKPKENKCTLKYVRNLTVWIYSAL